MANVNNTPDSSQGQDDSENQDLDQAKSAEDDCIHPLFPDLSSGTPASQNLNNATYMLIGSRAIQTILTGSPRWTEEDVPDLIAAMRWLWAFHGITNMAEDKEDFKKMLSFLMMD